MKPISTFMYREMETCWLYRVRKDEYATLSEVVENNLQADGTKFNIHVHRNVDISIYRVRKDEYVTLSEVTSWE